MLTSITKPPDTCYSAKNQCDSYKVTTCLELGSKLHQKMQEYMHRVISKEQEAQNN